MFSSIYGKWSVSQKKSGLGKKHYYIENERPKILSIKPVHN